MIAECDGLSQRSGKRPSWVYRGELGWLTVRDGRGAAQLHAPRLVPDQIEQQIDNAEHLGHHYDPRRAGDAAGLLEGLTLCGEVIIATCHRSAPVQASLISATLIGWRKFRGEQLLSRTAPTAA